MSGREPLVDEVGGVPQDDAYAATGKVFPLGRLEPELSAESRTLQGSK
jgi:hypothetical protein